MAEKYEAFLYVNNSIIIYYFMFFYIFLLITITYAKVRVWVDCDPGVDDAMALILAAHNPDT